MRPLRSVVIFLAIVFLGGALLAPWLWWLAQTGASWHAGLGGLARNPFHRFVNRSILILAVAGLWPLLRSLGVRGWREVGFCPPKTGWRRLLTGFAFGFGSLAIVAFVMLIAGVRALELHHLAARLLPHVVKAGLAAVVVAVLEELLFRGVLFGALRKIHGWMVALVLSSGFYALVHFFQKPPEPETVTWLSGFATLGRMLHGFVEWQQLVPGFFSLFVAGALLALAYQRTGNLYFSIGLHAGWIFWLKSLGLLTRATDTANGWFWGTDRLLDGWFAFVVLLALLGIFLKRPALFGKTQLADE